MALSFLTVPVELVYRILDNLDDVSIICSVRNVCLRLNMITDTYSRYQVNLEIESYFDDCKSIKMLIQCRH